MRTLEPRYGAKKLAWQASANLSGSVGSRLKGNVVGLGRRLLDLPDPQVLWLPAAHWALARRLRSARPDDVVFISGPPFSQFLLSALVSLSPRTAIVLDYRDEWSTTSSAFEMSGSARISARLEDAVLRRAHAVTTATDEFRTALLAQFPIPRSFAEVTAIPNGYDPEDFSAGAPVARRGPLHLDVRRHGVSLNQRQRPRRRRALAPRARARARPPARDPLRRPSSSTPRHATSRAARRSAYAGSAIWIDYAQAVEHLAGKPRRVVHPRRSERGRAHLPGEDLRNHATGPSLLGAHSRGCAGHSGATAPRRARSSRRETPKPSPPPSAVCCADFAMARPDYSRLPSTSSASIAACRPGSSPR